MNRRASFPVYSTEKSFLSAYGLAVTDDGKGIPAFHAGDSMACLFMITGAYSLKIKITAEAEMYFPNNKPVCGSRQCQRDQSHARPIQPLRVRYIDDD